MDSADSKDWDIWLGNAIAGVSEGFWRDSVSMLWFDWLESEDKFWGSATGSAFIAVPAQGAGGREGEV